VRAGAAVASLGSLLALIAGVGRTTLAMARNGDLPRRLDSVHPRNLVPDRAELAVAAVVCVLVLTTDLRGAIGFSSFGVLVYYAIANASAYTQPPEDRRWPRALNAAGFVACLVLVATLPAASALAGVGMFAVGIAGRALSRSVGVASGTQKLVDERPGRDGRDAGDRERADARGTPSREPRGCGLGRERGHDR
jgi:APA family basic amino acid/polyamine antiporter